MENASKALLMAGGILITILIVSLFVYAWNSYTEYNNTQDELKNVENLAKFNEQFVGYDRDDISGYELISLANKIADYNMRYSNLDDANSNDKYTPITMMIDLNTPGVNPSFSELVSYDNGGPYFFTNNEYTQSNVRNEIKDFITNATQMENLFGGSEKASKVARNIRSLVKADVEAQYRAQGMTDKQIEDKIRADYKQITGEDKSFDEIQDYIGNNAENVKAYYEYYQFKRIIFRCTNIEYDDISGRISRLDFEFTGEIE